jgi:hypothetical protein
MRSKKWIGDDGSTVLPEAYLRRPTDTDGLSVGTTPQAVKGLPLQIRGIASLRVNNIRIIINMDTKIHLDVVLNGDNPTHGNINTAIPYRSDNPILAEFLAGELARISKLLTENDTWVSAAFRTD